MYAFVLYAMLIWVAVYAQRRRWQAWAILAASIPVAWLGVRAMQWMAGSQNTMFLALAGVYEALILMVGVMLAIQPRTRRVHTACHKCRYDLAGNTSGFCPECGSTVPPAAPPRRTHPPAPRRKPAPRPAPDAAAAPVPAHVPVPVPAPTPTAAPDAVAPKSSVSLPA